MKKKLIMVTGRILSIGKLIVLLPLIIGLIACGKDDDNPVNAELSVSEMIDRGWERFEEADYSGALIEFEAAIERGGDIADAHNGAGWSAGQLTNSLSVAAASFSRSLATDTTMYDALGGWAFIAFQQDEFTSAIEKADSLLHRRPGWRFLHQTSLDFRDVRLMTAHSYFFMLDFESCYRIIVDYFTPSFVTDVDTEQGRIDLQQEMERLRRKYG